MLRLFSLIQKAKVEDVVSSQQTPSVSAAQIRLQRDINELDLPATCVTNFANPDDLFNFKIAIYPNEGFYSGGRFVFNFHIGKDYPHKPPQVKCETKLYHPNIDLEGNICLNILREDWKPILSLNSIVYGLLHLLLEPNPEDALNKEAADDLRNDPSHFGRNVTKAMAGDIVGETQFQRCIKNI